MTQEQAKSELMQIYGMLSEEKKQALDVLMEQVDGDTEKNCFNCKWYPDNGITKGFDEVCHKCSNSNKWEQAQADGEYISVDTVIEWLKDKDIIKMSNQERNARKELSALPSVAIPNKVGHWIRQKSPYGYSNTYECSECGRTIYADDQEDLEDYPYCHCGAKMD